MLEVRYYLLGDGSSPFAEWFADLDVIARTKVTVAITRVEQGNLSRVKSLGGGLLEYKIDFGPGYRVYFGRDGDVLVILLTGGTKKRQQNDIKTASAYWQDYKQSKRAMRRMRTGDG